MNAPIARLFLGMLVLFALLVGFTSNWAVFDAEDLQANAENKRPLLEAQQVERGRIISSDGEVIAESFPKGKGDDLRYIRRYPQGSLFGNPIGYSLIDQSSGFERAEEAVLTGDENEFVTLLDQIRGRSQEGSDIVTTLDAGAQRVAMDLLGQQGSPGAVVAIEPGTGAVKVMASTPGYDPNADAQTLAKLAADGTDSPLFDRTVQSTYPPGSTMKVVTAAAALDSGEFTPDSVLNADSPQVFSGVELANSGNESFGDIPMRTALTNSVNTYWARVGEQLGPETLLEYMERFGFLRDPQVELPDDQKAPSGIYALQKDGGSELVDEGFDIARVAIGQGGEEGSLLASPMQMAQVAATVANSGTLMRPTLVEAIKDPDGRTTEELDPEEQSEVMSEESAAALAEMMTSVVDEGTATALAGDLGGTPFAGKTGTAEIDVEAGLNQVWFIGFAPVEDPQIAIAATVERCTGCFGGDTAGPIATAVMRELLGG